MDILPYNLFHDHIASRVSIQDLHAIRCSCSSMKGYLDGLANARQVHQFSLKNNRSDVFDNDIGIVCRKVCGTMTLGVSITINVSLKPEYYHIADDVHNIRQDIDLEELMKRYDVNTSNNSNYPIRQISLWFCMDGCTYRAIDLDGFIHEIYIMNSFEVWDGLNINLRHSLMNYTIHFVERMMKLETHMSRKYSLFEHCQAKLMLALNKLQPSLSFQLGGVLFREYLTELASFNSDTKPLGKGISIIEFTSLSSYDVNQDNLLYGRNRAALAVVVNIESTSYNANVYVVLNGDVRLHRGSNLGIKLRGEQIIKDLNPCLTIQLMKWASIQLTRVNAHRVVVEPEDDTMCKEDDINLFLQKATSILEHSL